MDTRQKALQRLREARATADRIDYSWNESSRFHEWHLDVEITLGRLFGNDSLCLRRFNDIWWSPQVTYPDTREHEYIETFNAALGEAKAVISAAIRDAEDFASEPPTSSGADTKSDNGTSLQAIAAHELRQTPPVVRRSILILVVLALALFAVWNSLPEHSKTGALSRLTREAEKPSKPHDQAAKFRPVGPTWVYPDTPMMGLGNQFVVAVRNPAKSGADVHMSFQPPEVWTHLAVGDQLPFLYRGNKYALTVLRADDQSIQVRIDPEVR